MRRSVRPVLRRKANMVASLGVDGDGRRFGGLASVPADGTVLLRAHEPAHEPLVAPGEAQRRIDPALGHRIELPAANLIAKLAQTEHRLPAVVPPVAGGDPLLPRS